MAHKIMITQKTIVLTAVIGSLLIMASITANTIWESKQTAALTDEAVSAVSAFYLEAMADRRAKAITNLINDSFDEMEKAVTFIEGEQIGSQEELRNTIGKVESLLSLNRFALVDEDDIVYTRYTTYTGRSRHSFLSGEEKKSRTISTVSLYGSSRQLCLVIPTSDLSIMGKRIKDCFVQFDIQDIVDLLAFDDQGRTHFALYSKSGANLSGTDLGPVISDHNLFEAVRGIVSEDVLEEIQGNFANEKEGNLSFVSGSTHETLYYVPIQGTGWEMAVLIHESVIQDRIQGISKKYLETSKALIVFTLVSTLTLAIVILFQIRSLSKAKLLAEEENSRAFRNMANTDSLTGVRNKHAYSENEAVVNGRIQSGELQALGVVVCDINGLKFVNDTRGHAAGDQLIKDACAMICDYFKHGAVYRIGGDEFVVLLQGKGYETMREVIAELNRQVEANIKKNTVVISVGYSVLKQGNQQLRDIFDRADRMMYERKKELKAMGASSSRL